MHRQWDHGGHDSPSRRSFRERLRDPGQLGRATTASETTSCRVDKSRPFRHCHIRVVVRVDLVRVGPRSGTRERKRGLTRRQTEFGRTRRVRRRLFGPAHSAELRSREVRRRGRKLIEDQSVRRDLIVGKGKRWAKGRVQPLLSIAPSRIFSA